ncbi:uncharacterized protein V1516DRAFT_628642 [Lipomyces oligophaga]|uniref:uncharacterized protein n=1 Tax=Lipomyces oligophaga TaxID=45792 RepID=UPI0034CEBF41
MDQNGQVYGISDSTNLDPMVGLFSELHQNIQNRMATVHEGVMCDMCKRQPIYGVRYRCAQCDNVDLCQSCESLDKHRHVLYKIRIPMSIYNEPDFESRSFYPGDRWVADSLPMSLEVMELMKIRSNSGLEDHEIQTQWQKFRMLATIRNADRPNGAIAAAFDYSVLRKTLLPRKASPNILVDRIFQLYDRDNEGEVSFINYVVTRALISGADEARLECAFKIYDIRDVDHVKPQDLSLVLEGYLELSNELLAAGLRQTEKEIVDWSLVGGTRPLTSEFELESSSGPNIMTTVTKEMNDADWVIDKDSAAAADLDEIIFSDQDYETELRRIEMHGIEQVIDEVFVAGRPADPEKGMTKEEFLALAREPAMGIYNELLCSCLEFAKF